MKKDLKVVGIGSSAGGLEALQTLFSQINESTDVAYIVAQHLSPSHKSMMVDLLSRVSNLPVLEAKNGLVIKASTIYITPENTDIYVKDGKIFLKSINHIFGPKPSVNYLLSSIAQEFKQNSIGVILSGTGSDGAYGIRAIKVEGGITIAQSPATAKYDGMPFSAINTGKVDLVIPINELALEIDKIVHNLGKDIKNSINTNFVQEIFKLLFDETGVDFSMYKKNTISRRLIRRMQALKIDTLNDYVTYLKSNTNEVHSLYTDILIGVTSFFRDEKVFEELEVYMEKICEKKEQGEEIRFWSVGCSTGEEAYSLAILISEVLKDKVDKYKIKIFATDIDDESLKIARAGIYSETSLINMKKDYIHKYFNVLKSHYEVKKNIREMVVFSKHNIVSDSPFLRIDLISCRNMLIYFSSALQQRVFPIFHYSLKESGILLLGKSETVAEFGDLFYLVDKNLKIYKSQYTGIKEAPKLYNYGGFKTIHNNMELLKPKKSDENNIEEIIVNSLYDSILKNCVVINSSNEVIYNKGELPFIKLPQGKMTHNIFKLLDDDLVLDLRTAINDVNKSSKYQKIRFREIRIIDEIYKYVRAYVIPITNESIGDDFKVLFFEIEDLNVLPKSIDDTLGDDSKVLKLKEELETNKLHLQNVIEELETSYEEMQSLNEELQSSNEELQSSNEELETTNEELQSTNEELQTAYSELKILYDDKENRTRLLEDLTDKLKIKTEDFRKQKEISEAIINTVPVAILFVDDKSLITYINSNAKRLLDIENKIILNKSFDSKNWNFSNFKGEKIDDEELPFSIIKKTFEKISNYHLMVEINEIKLYLNLNGAPLFDSEGKFMGAVFSLDDLTQNIQNEKIVKDYENRIKKGESDFVSNLKYYDSYSIIRKEKADNDVLKLLYGEFNIEYRNKLNEINLLINQITDNKNMKLVNQINKILNEASGSLDYFGDYFEENSFKIIPIESTFKNSLQLFKDFIKSKEVIFQEIKFNQTEILLEDRNSKQIFMIFIEFLIHLSTEILKSKIYVEIIFQKRDIAFKIKNRTKDLSKYDNIFSDDNLIFKTIVSSLSRVGLNFEFEFQDKELLIGIKK